MKNATSLLIFLLLMIGEIASAQQEVYKVSKLISRTFPSEVKTVEINGEKAIIDIEGWSNNYIDVQIRLVGRNVNKKIAEGDLQFIKTDLLQTGSMLTMKNFFYGKNSSISSNLSVEYVVKVPLSVSLNVKNLYGKVMVKNLANQLCAEVSFGALELESVQGNSTITATYSTVRGNNIDGSLTCTIEKTDIDLLNLNAPVKIDSKYGEVALMLVSNQYNVTVNGHRTKLQVSLPNKPFNYKLKTLYSEIHLPDLPIVKTDFYEKKNDEKVATIDLVTSYCPITINHEN